MRKLSVIRGTYGVSEHDVIYLDYNEGGEVPTYEVIDNCVDIGVINRIKYAIENGFVVEFEGIFTNIEGWNK